MMNNRQGSATDDEPLVAVDGISKKFCRELKRSLYYGFRDIAREAAGRRSEERVLRAGEFWAVRNVSMELRRGEALALVGTNGSGKTTLLRMIAGLIKPDAGRVRVRGRVAPLLAAGVGFQPVLTGRENIYANMAVLGLTKREIDERFEQVVDFAEVDSALDAPVRTYSSGMRARLGFACAIHVDPDILLLDEILGVGDIEFRAKCYRKLEELRARGVTFVVVAHNSEIILSICDRAVYLDRSRWVASGSADEIIARYERDLFVKGKESKESGFWKRAAKPPGESAGLDFTEIRFEGDGRETQPGPGDLAVFHIRVAAHQRVENAVLNVGIMGQNQLQLLYFSSRDQDRSYSFDLGESEVCLRLPGLSLKPGTYSAHLSIGCEGSLAFDTVANFRFSVRDDGIMRNFDKCQFYQKMDWGGEVLEV